MMEISRVNLCHQFLETSYIRVETMELRDISTDSGLCDLRMILRSKGMANSNEQMTVAAASSESRLLWNDPGIYLPVVDEYFLSVECCEYDQISSNHEEVG
jgi:hypothetical protein